MYRYIRSHITPPRYVQWHNLMVRSVSHNSQKGQGAPHHVLYYEDYTTRFNETIQDLASFLELPIRRTPLKFVTGKTYADMFNHSEMEAASHLAKHLASPPCWNLIGHYFRDALTMIAMKDRLQGR
jgi:hypothetical protein